MKTYLIHLKSPHSGTIKVVYREDGLLDQFQNFSSINTPDELVKVFSRIPIEESHISQLRAAGSKITLAPEDLSFDRFWNKYNYKVGKKARAEKLWDTLREVDKIEAINAIDKYNAWLSQKTIEKVYPETYLSQRRWENEFTGIPTLFNR